MSNEEAEIYELLKRFPHHFVGVTDISKAVGSRRNYNEDRSWTLPLLRRMELEGVIESNSFGGYRLKRMPDETTSFKKALETPGMPLGDTAIITLSDVGEIRAEAV